MTQKMQSSAASMPIPYTEALEAALGAVIKDTRREFELYQAKTDALLADARSQLVEMKAANAVAVETIVALSTELRAAVDQRLATLKDGENGVDGKDGAAGADGAPGLDGRDGVDGKDGACGRDGAPGERGADADLPDLSEFVKRAELQSELTTVGLSMLETMARDADVVAALAERIDSIVIPEAIHGRDADPEEIRGMVAAAVTEAVAALPVAENGKDGAPGEKGDTGERGADGLLPIVKAWADGVHYAGAVVTYRGATYQAQRDTGRLPPHDDWACLAAAGADGRTAAYVGTYDAAQEYRALDVVALNGGSFVALRDNPGDCPGEGWQLVSGRGKTGEKGLKGDRGDSIKGDRGEPGPAIIAGIVNAEGVLTLTRDDGVEVTADFYPVLRSLQ
jgi:hypothetical protein